MAQATFAQIELTFNEDLNVGDNLSFFYIATSIMTETWKNVRSAPNEVTVGTPTAIPGERSAINYIQAIQLDYNSSGLFVISRNQNTVTIRATNPLLQFGFLPGQPDVNVSYVINNNTEDLFYIQSVTFLAPSSDPCSKVKVEVQTSTTAAKITSPVSVDPNTDNPFTFEYVRGTGMLIKCESDGGQERSAPVNMPSLLSPDYVDFQMVPTPEGSSVTVDVSFPPQLSYGIGNELVDIINGGLDLQYSLDNSTFQNSNIFSGLPEGDYTVWVKDQFGCKISKTFHVDAFGIQDPYFYISKANSIQFALRENFGNCGPYKNDKNTLSNEIDVPIAYTEIQQFQTCDNNIPTQFRSNYANISAKVVECETGVQTSFMALPVIKKTNNMRLKDRRDAIKYNLGNGKTGVYFTAGNIYDYDLGTDIGDYTLNGLLPLWGKIGNYIKVGTAWFIIENIVFDETRNAEVLVISNTYTGQDATFQAYSLYNKEIYEVYEFYLNMGQFSNKKIKVKFYNNSDYYEDLIYESEWIDVKEHQKNTVEIRYKNKTNTDIFFATGIEHKIRIPIEKISGKPETESEVHKTDTTTVLLSAENHETNVFDFQPVTKQMMWKLVQALSHSDVYIDGVRYVKESLEVEGPLEETNLYEVTATMIKAAGKEIDDSNLDFSGSNIEIPGLIETESGYVEY